MNKKRKKTKLPLEYQVEYFFKEVLYLSNELSLNKSNNSKKILDKENIDFKTLVYEGMKEYENLIENFRIKSLRETKTYTKQKPHKRNFKIKNFTRNKTDIPNFNTFDTKIKYNEIYKSDKNDYNKNDSYYLDNPKISKKKIDSNNKENKIYLKLPKYNTSYAKKRNKSDDKFNDFDFKFNKTSKEKNNLIKKIPFHYRKDIIVDNNDINPSDNFHISDKFENNETFYTSYRYKNKLKNINNKESDTSNEIYKNKNYINDKYETSNDIFTNKYIKSNKIKSRNENYTNDKLSNNYTDFKENSIVKPKNRWIKPKTILKNDLSPRFKTPFSKNNEEPQIISKNHKTSLIKKNLVHKFNTTSENKILVNNENKTSQNIFYKKNIKKIGLNINNNNDNKKLSRNNKNVDINNYKTEPNLININYKEKKEKILEGKEKLKEVIKVKEETEKKRLKKIRKK